MPLAAGLGRAGAQAPNDGNGSAARPLSADAAHAAAPRITAARLTHAITLDAHLDESAWAAAIPATEFRQSEPNDGAPASERTEVRILYDDDAIYVGARLFAPRGGVSSRLGRRDAELSDSDWFIVVFDSYHDHTGGYRFKVNPAGVIGDEANGDRSWNPVWTVATSVDSTGWTAEMRIPFSQLRFSPASEQVWGVQFYREINATAEKLVFSYSPRRERGGPSRFGHLLGVRDIKRGKVIEVLPYAAASAEFKAIPQSASASFRNPFRDGTDYFRQVGADIKYRLTSNFTVDAALNPDFGQIEADESQVNLSANESYFREQRPFFVEGSNIFRFGMGVGGGGFGGGFGGGGGGGGGGMGGGGGQAQTFYSRRVGRAPQGSVPGASVYAEAPSASTILGAAKITGRTPGGWTVGVLEAVTARETATWVDSASQRYSSEVEPQSSYFVARARKDLREGQSNIGGIVTMANRNLADSALAQRLRSSAYVAGVDFGHLFGNRTWEVSGSLAGSHIIGSESVMISAQRSSARYFQRPDATYLGVDSAATSLSGWTGALNVSKSAGLHWTGNLRTSAVSPGYEINDLGFQNSSDRISVSGGVNYDENDPGRVLRKWGMGLRPEMRANFGGDIVGRAVRGDADAQLLNYVSGRINFSRDLSSLDDRLTRGGPLAHTLPSGNISVNLNGDSRKAYTWSLSASERQDDSGAWAQSRNAQFGFKPAGWWGGELSANYSRSRSTAQYVTSVYDTLATGTFGRRYVFAGIAQTTVSLTTRLNVTMSPRLTFAFVAEPFIASGAYGTPKELRAPRTYDFNVFGRDVGTARYDADAHSYEIDPDGAGPASAFTVSDRSFNTRSVNATGNLRWEWRPGCTLFLVWQHRRSNPATYGDFDWRRDGRELLGGRADNVLLFKLNYWWNP